MADTLVLEGFGPNLDRARPRPNVAALNCRNVRLGWAIRGLPGLGHVPFHNQAVQASILLH